MWPGDPKCRAVEYQPYDAYKGSTCGGTSTVVAKSRPLAVPYTPYYVALWIPAPLYDLRPDLLRVANVATVPGFNTRLPDEILMRSTLNPLTALLC